MMESTIVGTNPMRGKYKLASLNAHPRDARIEFVEDTHTYYIDERKVSLSVSGLWSRYFEEFNPEETVNKYFDAWKVDPNSKYHTLIKFMQVVLGWSVSDQKNGIVRLWNGSGLDASTLGTYMHLQIELFMNDETHDASSAEFQQFSAWWKAFQTEHRVRPFRTEWSIYDEERDIAGQVDALFITEEGKYIMVDWKRCAPTPKYKADGQDVLSMHNKSFRDQRGIGACKSLPNTKFYHYVVQQNLYRYLLETKYDIAVDKMFLAQFHPQLDTYNCVEVPDIQTIVKQIMQERGQEITNQRDNTASFF